uniref:Uncharacterized protein n=1 Tax=Oryza rufipogon TaxID=4529 RepID=A0A0E0Q873_ORYRU
MPKDGAGMTGRWRWGQVDAGSEGREWQQCGEAPPLVPLLIAGSYGWSRSRVAAVEEARSTMVGGRGGELLPRRICISAWARSIEVLVAVIASFLPIVRHSSTDARPPGSSFPTIPPALRLATVWIEAAGTDGACDGVEWIQKRCCGERLRGQRPVLRPLHRGHANLLCFNSSSW